MITYGLSGWIISLFVILGFSMFCCGCFLSVFVDTRHKITKIAYAIIAIIGMIIFFGALFITTEIPHDGLAVDEQGNWYGEGFHLKTLTIVPNKGLIVIDSNKVLEYNLTSEEIISLGDSRNYKEKIKEKVYIAWSDETFVGPGDGMKYYRYDIVMRNLSSGIDPNHLKLVISVNS